MHHDYSGDLLQALIERNLACSLHPLMKYVTAVIVFLVCSSTVANAQPATRVFLNGIPTPVYFNDGDSFRVLAGKFDNTRARMAGFNTLESYGPVHIWGTWTAHELARYATLGTMNARRGVWRCTSDLKRDGYGRILWDCPDLAIDQVRKGLAHAMTVTKKPAAEALRKAQQEAIKHRRGIWAHGVPDFIMTSTHSASEWRGGRMPYNRLVSSADGHSEKWKHRVSFMECQTVCQPVPDPDQAKIVASVQAMRAQAYLQSVLKHYVDAELVAMTGQFAREGYVKAFKEAAHRQPIEQWLTRVSASGRLATSGKPSSCMVYVDFKRRYGGGKASCLRN